MKQFFQYVFNENFKIRIEVTKQIFLYILYENFKIYIEVLTISIIPLLIRVI